MTRNPEFKVTPLFDVEYLGNGQTVQDRYIVTMEY